MSGVLAAMMAGSPGFINGSLPSHNNGGNGATITWELQNDGDLSYGDPTNGFGTEDWVTPSESDVASKWEVKVDVTAGSFTSGTTGSFLALGTTRTWTKAPSGTVTFDVTFREAASGTVRSVQTGIQLTATSP